MITFLEKPEAARGAGAYALLIQLKATLAVTAGGRGAQLAPGLYIYCGSAKGSGGLGARLARHRRRDKRPHWHVDQLTRKGALLGAWIAPGGDECSLNEDLRELPIPLPGFGSSDCPRCQSHLRYWPRGAALPHSWETPAGALDLLAKRSQRDD